MADMSPNDEKRRNRIDASSLTPQRAGLRFDVVPFVLGYMEQFARADFRIAAMAGTPESFAVSNANLQVLAQSVLASSHIEQEGVYGAEVELVFAAVTQPEDGVPRNGELSERVQAIVDITRAAKWAIESQARFKDWLSFEFVIELHRRMFRATQPQIAGKIKTDEVVISGALYDVSTVPKADAERFLRSLCERLNQRLLRAEAQGTENLI